MSASRMGEAAQPVLVNELLFRDPKKSEWLGQKGRDAAVPDLGLEILVLSRWR